MKVVEIFSGGLDSTVLLYHLLNHGHEVKCLSVNYGQRHQTELLAAAEICKRLGIPHEVADLRPIMRLLGGSALTDANIPVPQGHYTEERMKVTVVPNRNMIMVSVAAGWAISQGCGAVAYAAHLSDWTIYPDCRLKFKSELGKALRLCHFTPIELMAPFICMSKVEVVARGVELSVPFELTYSCYEGKEKHCGLCGTCTERKEAFKLAGVPDPTVYAE